MSALDLTFSQCGAACISHTFCMWNRFLRISWLDQLGAVVYVDVTDYSSMHIVGLSYSYNNYVVSFKIKSRFLIAFCKIQLVTFEYMYFTLSYEKQNEIERLIRPYKINHSTENSQGQYDSS